MRRTLKRWLARDFDCAIFARIVQSSTCCVQMAPSTSCRRTATHTASLVGSRSLRFGTQKLSTDFLHITHNTSKMSLLYNLSDHAKIRKEFHSTHDLICIAKDESETNQLCIHFCIDGKDPRPTDCTGCMNTWCFRRASTTKT